MISRKAFHGLSAVFDRPISFYNRTLVIQFYARSDANITCSGANIKLYSEKNFNPLNYSRDVPWMLMFGPDRCDFKVNKIYFQFRHRNNVTGHFQVHEIPDPPTSTLCEYGTFYRLTVYPDNRYEVLTNTTVIRSGSLLLGITPPVNPPEFLDDPTDSKPADWAEDEFIINESAVKPDDWVDQELIPDPSRLKPPRGWLVDEPTEIPDTSRTPPPDSDQNWTPPMIPNPRCLEAVGCGPYEPPLARNPKWKGEWKKPTIKNPLYKGPWKARQIPNPEFFEDLHPHNFPAFTGIGFDLWTADGNISFCELIISVDVQAVREYTQATYAEFRKEYPGMFRHEKEPESWLILKGAMPDKTTLVVSCTFIVMVIGVLISFTKFAGINTGQV
jgi:calnexin